MEFNPRFLELESFCCPNQMSGSHGAHDLGLVLWGSDSPGLTGDQDMC